MTKATLLGIGKLTSKVGKVFTVFHVATAFGTKDINKGCSGMRVESIFLPDELVVQVDYSLIGRELYLEYEVTNGKGYLVGFAPVPEADKTDKSGK